MKAGLISFVSFSAVDHCARYSIERGSHPDGASGRLRRSTGTRCHRAAAHRCWSSESTASLPPSTRAHSWTSCSRVSTKPVIRIGLSRESKSIMIAHPPGSKSTHAVSSRCAVDCRDRCQSRLPHFRLGWIRLRSSRCLHTPMRSSSRCENPQMGLFDRPQARLRGFRDSLGLAASRFGFCFQPLTLIGEHEEHAKTPVRRAIRVG
jgi:hypothetical protein